MSISLYQSSDLQFPILTSIENLQGVAKEAYNEINCLRSLVILEKFQEITNIQAIAVIGSSASGKTTLLKDVRSQFSSSEDISLSKRFITRPVRKGDDLIENQHVSLHEFEEKVISGEIEVSWKRKMEGERVEFYGFEKDRKDKIRIYSANNDFVRGVDEISKTILILGVYAPDELRKERLLSRSPDLTPEELGYRLGDSSQNIIPFCHLLIKNFGPTEESSITDIIALIKIVAQKCLRWGEMRDLGNHRCEHKSRLFEITNHDVLFSNGIIKQFQYVERSPGTRVLVTDGSRILLTKEWREEINGWDYRLPGGKIFETVKEYKEDRSFHQDFGNVAKKAAMKEIFEETGVLLSEKNISFASLSKCGSLIKWDLYYFIANLPPASNLNRRVTDESEMIQPIWFSFADVKSLCLNGAINEERSALFILKFILKGDV